VYYVGDRFERFCSDADWAGGTVEKHRVRFLVMVSVFEGVDENRTRFMKHLFRDWVIVSEVALFVCDLGRILVVSGGF